MVLYNRALNATNCNIDARANIVAVYTDCHCIVQSVQYQIEKTDENSGHYIVCQQSTARTATAGKPHARANNVIFH